MNVQNTSAPGQESSRSGRRPRAAISWLCGLLIIAQLACTSTSASGPQPGARPQPGAALTAAPARVVTLSIIGTSDLHGALERLPILAGYVNNVRAVRERDGGVVLVDGGDMFQGTIESNINEGAAVIAAYGALGYTAAAIGNHEFDFGPAGAAATPEQPGDDPRGALLERIAQAGFPLLAANLLDTSGDARVRWPGAPPSVIREVAGVSVGIIGVTTESTPYTTMAANFAGLAIAPLAETISREAGELRARGAGVIVVAAHAGGGCRDLSNPEDSSSCAPDEEIMAVAEALPPGLVDVIVGGHTHKAMAHRINGIPIMVSYSRAQAFGRVDLSVELVPAPGAGSKGRATPGALINVEVARIFPPQELCPGEQRVPVSECRPGEYEGRPVVADEAVAAVIAAPLAAAEALRNRSLSVDVKSPILRAYDRESAMGNLLADLMRKAVSADVAVTNGGGLRADLPAGALTYGALYEVIPFDNRFATVKLRGAELARVVAGNLQARSGIFLLSGVRATASCKAGQLVVSLVRDNGKRVADNELLTVVTSDFLASGGDGAFGSLGLPDGAIRMLGGETLRDGVARVLSAAGGTLAGDDRRLFDPAAPRIHYRGIRPLDCR